MATKPLSEMMDAELIRERDTYLKLAAGQRALEYLILANQHDSELTRRKCNP